MKSVTLQDVADLAGVSAGTVSKYINGQKIRPQNALLVKSAIEKLNYSPNPLAQNFARGRTFDILLFLIVESPITATTWQHELPIIQAINDVLIDTPYNLKIKIAYTDNPERNCNYMQTCINGHHVDAIMLLSPWKIDTALIRTVKNGNIPYILIGSNTEIDCHSVDFDNETPIYNIVKHLYENGHRHFAMLAGFKNQYHITKRELGFRRALRDLEINSDNIHILYGDFSTESGMLMANNLLNLHPYPTAFICGNDSIAAGAIHAVLDHGLSVPEDIAVSGFDNSVVATVMYPSITSVASPSYEMGKGAITEVLSLLQDHNHCIKKSLFPSQIIYRRSTEGKAKDLY